MPDPAPASGFGSSPGPRSRPVVGGLPWAAPEAVAAPIERAPRPRQTPAADAAFAVPTWAEVRDWWRRTVARSPAFTASLAVHALLLVALALVVIRRPAAERLRLELAFGPADRPPGLDRPSPAPREELAAPPVEVVAIEAPRPPTPVDPAPAVPAAVAAVAQPPAAAAAASAAPSVAASLSGRDAASRSRLVGDGGGSPETESAVAAALEWLVRQQRADGLWSLQGPYLDGSRQENRLAASAMALLALQGAGNTAAEGEHREAVAKAWKTLLKLQQPDGTFDAGLMIEQHRMYAHGQITIALCEAYGMTREPRFEGPARRALDFCVAAQMPDGGWRYEPPRAGGDNRGDMSVTGWFLMALKSGEMAGLAVPPETFARLEAFLDGVFVGPDLGYGYQITPGKKVFDFRPALTAEALLCRQYLGWRRDDPRLVAGVELLLREAPIDFDYRRKNVYAWYYQTQVCHHAGGAAWQAWNQRMQEQLLPAQVQTGRERGSWDPANDQWGHIGGRLFMTSLCACMLEVYYRHLSLAGDP